MKKILVDYVVISDDRLSELKRRVKLYLEDGYELLGGVSVVIRDGLDVLYQTLVKYETPLVRPVEGVK